MSASTIWFFFQNVLEIGDIPVPNLRNIVTV